MTKDKKCEANSCGNSEFASLFFDPFAIRCSLQSLLQPKKTLLPFETALTSEKVKPRSCQRKSGAQPSV